MSDTRTIAIVGAGPKGAGLLERLVASAPELLAGHHLVVHLIDPHPPGAGRVWRADQSALLRMNSMPEDVTMFTDDTLTGDGPVVPGPTLAEWVAGVADGTITAELDPAVRAEAATVTTTTFPTRRLQHGYLSWFFDHVVAAAEGIAEVHVHPTRALDITGEPGGPQRVHLDGGAAVDADVVVLALGHLDAEPEGWEADLVAHADAHGLTYLPPGYTADVDLSALRGGEPVLVRGFGLAFVDLAVLLSEGRGGRFTEDGRGGLVYHRGGDEPVLYVGSRRGVPYHAKPEYRLCGPRPPLPRFFGPDQVAELAGRDRQVDFRTEVWPLAAKEIGWGYYHELFTGHPDRTRMDFAEFADRYAELDWHSEELRTLVAKAVPADADRLDLAGLDRPLRGCTFAGRTEFAGYLRGYIEADLDRRADREHSADLGGFLALLSVFGQLARLVVSGRLTPDAQCDDVDGWWFGFFSYYASGPPGHRLRELLALMAAGVVVPLGPDLQVRAEADRWVAHSPALPGEVAATALVEARLPAPSLTHTTDPLLRTLHRRGAVTEEVLGGRRGSGRVHVSRAGELRTADGTVHPDRFGLGPHTSVRAPGAFARPGTAAPGLRQNDALARRVLRRLAERTPLPPDSDRA